MDKNTLEKLIKSNSFEEAIRINFKETLSLFEKIDFANVSEENIQHCLEDLFLLLTKKEKFSLVIDAIILLLETEVEYTIAVETMLCMFENLKVQSRESQIHVLEIINKADNLVIESSSLEKIAIPILLSLIDEKTFLRNNELSEYAIEIIGSLTAYGLPKTFLDAFENDHINNVAIASSQNAHSYSKEDKIKILQKISQKLKMKTTSSHVYLLLACLILIEDDHPSLFLYFKKTTTEEKIIILTKMQDLLTFLPIHESILQYSFQDQNVAKYVDVIYDKQKKNPHKKELEKIKTWGDFWSFSQQMLKDRCETYKNSLESYLKGVLYTLMKSKGKNLQIRDIALLLQNSFTSFAAVRDASWEKLDAVDDDTFEEVEMMLKEQIIDLQEMKKENLLKSMDEEGIEAPSGNHWQNVDLFVYLKNGIDGHEQSSVETCRWDDLANIFLMGRISE